MSYVVGWGDTPESIAERFGVAWADVVRLNPALQINPRFIYAGQVIQVPATRPRTVTPIPPEFVPLPPATRPRTVTPPTDTTPPKESKTLAQLLGLDKLSEKDKQLLQWGALGVGLLLLLAITADD